jgi:CheY-like chemotaxis protein
MDATLRRVMGEATHILVVEDDPDLRSSLRDLLEGESYEVMESEDGVDALAKLRSGPPPSLILLDLMMPRMDGWQFMDEVRVFPALRQVPIVVVSAYGTAEGVRSAAATDYLRKPFDAETLLGVVSRHAQPRRSN